MEEVRIKNHIAFMTVNYDDGDASTYKCLEISYGSRVKLFATGNPLIDWYDYCKFIYDGEAGDEGIGSIGHSSSVDHWFMDSKLYTEKYLKLVDNDHYEFYSNDELDGMSLRQIQGKKMCVIKKDMKTFQELKDYYKLNKK